MPFLRPGGGPGAAPGVHHHPPVQRRSNRWRPPLVWQQSRRERRRAFRCNTLRGRSSRPARLFADAANKPRRAVERDHHPYLYGGQRGLAGTSPVIGRGGAIYGLSGQGPLGYGFVFSLSPPSSPGGTWSFVDIYDFTSRSNEGGQEAPLAVDGSGVIYGTQFGDGRPGGPGGVYSLTPPVSPGGQWTETVLHTFTGEDGSLPVAGVVVGNGGVLYGTTAGSTNGEGVVFSLAPPSSAGGEWTYTVLAYLSDGSVGLEPAGGVVIGAGGVLYGVTQ